MLKLKRLAWPIAILMLTLNAGCAGPSGDYCQLAKPIWFDTDADISLTPTGVKRQIREHNNTVVRLCK